MNSKILVTYASQAGSTKGIAEAIAALLTENGFAVDTVSMKDVKSLDEYRTVVAGSAIHGGKWLPEATAFLRHFRGSLAGKTVFAFYVCMALTMKSMQGVDTGNLLDPIRRLVPLAGERGFAGAVDFDRLPLFPDRLVIKGIVSSGLWQAGDHRDWQAVREWAGVIARKMNY